jgi:hypothetical protein
VHNEYLEGDDDHACIFTICHALLAGAARHAQLPQPRADARVPILHQGASSIHTAHTQAGSKVPAPGLIIGLQCLYAAAGAGCQLLRVLRFVLYATCAHGEYLGWRNRHC